jgi:hypothetical protein
MEFVMNDRQRVMAILNYEQADRIPVVHFGYWYETLDKWAAQGHISQDIAKNWADGSPEDTELADILGFDLNWGAAYSPHVGLIPLFESKVLKVHPDGSEELLQGDGTVVLHKEGAGSIPAEIDHTLKDRRSWEEHYLPKLEFSPDRIGKSLVNTGKEYKRFDQGGLEYLQNPDTLSGIHCGSMFGTIRNWLGVVGASYMMMDDPDLLDEIIETVANLAHKCVEYTLKKGCKFDFGHYWEDICFKNGPLVTPSFFEEKVGPYYKKTTSMLNEHGINIVSLDCDGKIDALVPIWLKNGVNTMFPIEVGTWNASIAPWRQQYGKEVRGVGGMNKTVFARDRGAIDAEIERLKPLVELGGYIPCPDHRIAPDAEWDNVKYYCEKMRKSF